MSPIISSMNQRQNNSILNICIYKMLLATNENNINIQDVGNVLCDVIKSCDEEFINDPNEICEKIKDKIYRAFNIELEI